MTAKKKLPPGYIAYENKCYAKAKTAEDKAFLKKHLQKLVETLQKQEKFWLASWGLFKCPELPSEKNVEGKKKDAKEAFFKTNVPKKQKAPAVVEKSVAQEAPTTTESSTVQQQQIAAQYQQMYQQNPYYTAYAVPSYYGMDAQGVAAYNQAYAQYANAQPYYPTYQPAPEQPPPQPKKSPQKNNKKRKREQQQSMAPLSRKDKKKKHRAGDIYSAGYEDKWDAPLGNSHKWDANRISALPSLEGIKVKPLVGTCTRLEKDYVRLTSESDPAKVRPQEVLEKTLKLLKHKYLHERADYTYMENQLKSMRQDLTVQCIQNSFTVRVYESHARIALQNDDLNQFNQCQSQLKMLYAKGVPGNKEEFTAYRLMYYAFVNNLASLTTDLRELSEETRRDSHIQYALRVICALNERNLYKIFGELHDTAPKMSADLIQVFATQLREDYLLVLGKSHSPTKIPRDFLQKMLGLKSKRSFKEFMKKYELTADEELMDSKEIVNKIREYRINLKQK